MAMANETVNPDDVMAHLKATPERVATCEPQNLKKEIFVLLPKDLTKWVAGFVYFNLFNMEDGSVRLVLTQMGDRVVHLQTGEARYPDYEINFTVLSKKGSH